MTIKMGQRSLPLVTLSTPQVHKTLTPGWVMPVTPLLQRGVTDLLIIIIVKVFVLFLFVLL